MQKYNTAEPFERQEGNCKQSQVVKSSRPKVLHNDKRADITAGDKFADRQYRAKFLERNSIEIPAFVFNSPKESAIPVYKTLVREVGIQGEVKLETIAEQTGYSVRTVRRVLKDFEERSAGLFIRENILGRGRGTRIRNKFFRNQLRWNLGRSFQKARFSSKAVPEGDNLPGQVRDNNNTYKKHCLKKSDSRGSAFSQKSKNSTTGRQAKLNQLPEDVELHKGESYHAWTMEKIRRYIWLTLQDGDTSETAQEVNRIITALIGLQLDGRTIKDARELFDRLQDAYELVWQVERVVQGGPEFDPFAAAHRGLIELYPTSEHNGDSLKTADSPVKPMHTKENHSSFNPTYQEKRSEKEERPEDWEYTGMQTISEIVGGEDKAEKGELSALEERAIKIAGTYGVKAASRRTGVKQSKIRKLKNGGGKNVKN